MGALDAISVATDALGRNAVPLAAVGAVVAIGGGVAPAANQLPVPLVNVLLAAGIGLVWFFVEPFVAAGFLGMADEALDGETEYGTATEAGREHYLDLLVARGIVGAVRLAVGAIVTVVSVVLLFAIVGLSIGPMEGASDQEVLSAALLASGVALVVVLLVVLLAWLVQAAVGFFVQFYAAAIVLEGEDLLGGFSRSVEVVREHPASVAGYSALVWVVGIVVGLPLVAVVYLRGYATRTPVTGVDPTAVTAPEAALTVVAVALLFVLRLVTVPVLRTYHVAFYRDLVGEDPP